MKSSFVTALSILVLCFYVPAYAEGGGERTNSGVSWFEVAAGLNNNAMIMGLAAAPDGKVYSGSAGHGTYVTGDNGITWKKLTMKDNTTDNDITTSVYAHPGGKIYVGQSSGYVFVSQDQGNSFDTLCRVGSGPQGVASFASDKENNIYFITSDGEFGIYGPGDTKLKTGKIDGLNTIAWSVTVDFQGRIFVGAMGEGIYCSSDEGETWFKTNNGLPSLDVHKVAFSPMGVLFAGLSGSGGLYRSYDYGVTWLPSMNGMDSLIVMDILFCKNPKIVFAATTKDLFKSEDGGNNWYSVKNDLPDLANYRRLALDQEDYLYVGSLPGKIYRSKDPVKVDKGPLSISVEPATEINVEPGKSVNMVITIIDTEGLPVENACIWVADSVTNLKKAVYTDKYGEAKYLLSVSSNCAHGDYPVTFYAMEVEHKNSDTVRKIVHVKPETSAPTGEPFNPIKLRVRPNPVVNELVISFETVTGGTAEISLYDLEGNRAATILRDHLDKGICAIPWRPVGLSDGAYFLEMRIGETVSYELIIIDK